MHVCFFIRKHTLKLTAYGRIPIFFSLRLVFFCNGCLIQVPTFFEMDLKSDIFLVEIAGMGVY